MNNFEFDGYSRQLLLFFNKLIDMYSDKDHYYIRICLNKFTTLYNLSNKFIFVIQASVKGSNVSCEARVARLVSL